MPTISGARDKTFCGVIRSDVSGTGVPQIMGLPLRAESSVVRRGGELSRGPVRLLHLPSSSSSHVWVRTDIRPSVIASIFPVHVIMDIVSTNINVLEQLFDLQAVALLFDGVSSPSRDVEGRRCTYLEFCVPTPFTFNVLRKNYIFRFVITYNKSL